jgi:hypothetical protein
MDMSELTREELDTRLDTIESRIDRRFSENDAKMEARFAQAEARNEARFAQAETRNDARFAAIDARFTEADTRARQQTVELIKWMITTALAATAIGGGFLGMLISYSSPRQPPAPIVITIPAPVQPAPAR